MHIDDQIMKCNKNMPNISISVEYISLDKSPGHMYTEISIRLLHLILKPKG